ncbi:MAG TPA: BlaI/MecI/CopY family transcriptional regulator, partial [bacterium]
GPVQLRIMQVLWENQHVNAREITEALNEESAIAHSTVQTLLRKLEKKGAIHHQVQDRTFVYYALVQPDQVLKKASREIIERMLQGSVGDLVCYLIKHERISSPELEQIRRLIKAKEENP